MRSKPDNEILQTFHHYRSRKWLVSYLRYLRWYCNTGWATCLCKKWITWWRVWPMSKHCAFTLSLLGRWTSSFMINQQDPGEKYWVHCHLTAGDSSYPIQSSQQAAFKVKPHEHWTVVHFLTMSLTLNRLQEERYSWSSTSAACAKNNRRVCRKQWRRDHPFGFFAKPARNPTTGVLDLKKWECGVPGKENTIWDGGLFKLELVFPDGTYSPCSSTSWRHC